MKMEKRCIFEVNSEEYNFASLPVTVEHLITDLIKRNGNGQCCVDSVQLEPTGTKFFILQFSSPIDVQINMESRFLGKRLMYMSHIKQTSQEGKSSNVAFFKQKEELFYQNSDGNICRSSFGILKKVKMIAFVFPDDKEITESLDHFVYDVRYRNILARNI